MTEKLLNFMLNLKQNFMYFIYKTSGQMVRPWRERVGGGGGWVTHYHVPYECEIIKLHATLTGSFAYWVTSFKTMPINKKKKKTFLQVL